MEVFHQLGELFLQSVPTVVLVFLFYFLLRWSFFRPLERVLSERRARTEGARREAELSQAAAQERIRAYQEASRKARAALYAEQDAARRALLGDRLAQVRAARDRATQEIRAAKDTIAAELPSARGEMEAASQALAGEIARAILERRPSPSSRLSETQ